MKINEQVILKHEKFAEFLIVRTGEEKYEKTCFEFIVKQIVGYVYDTDDYALEPYMEGHIKWDGCMNVDFGENDCKTHFCGLRDFDKQLALVEKLYEIAAESMDKADFNNDRKKFNYVLEAN